MLLLHEVHTVAGRHEDEFEAPCRDGWMPAVASTDDAAPPVLPQARARHRPRVPHVVTITALRDGARVRTTREARADAATCARGPRTSTGCATKSPASCCFLSSGHRCTISTSRPSRPTAASTSRGCTWKTARGRTKRSSTRTSKPPRTHYAPSLEQRTERSLLTLLGVFQAALGARAAPRGRAVAAGRLPRAPARRCSRCELPRAREGPGHVDARRAPGPRRLGEPPPPQRGLVTAAASGQSQAVPPGLPPSSGHSPAKTPQLHSKPGTTHACAIQMSVSSRFSPPRCRALLAVWLLAADDGATLAEAEAAVGVVLVPVVVRAREAFGRAARVEHEEAEADDLRVGVRCRRTAARTASAGSNFATRPMFV